MIFNWFITISWMIISRLPIHKPTYFESKDYISRRQTSCTPVRYDQRLQHFSQNTKAIEKASKSKANTSFSMLSVEMSDFFGRPADKML